ncbi:hypothetical protein [Ekhidna sp.]
MNNYKFLKQKSFEKREGFEKRLHDISGQGWKVHSFSVDHGAITVMLERER